MVRMFKLVGAFALAATLLNVAPASAQTPSQSHLAAAWEAIRAVGADARFDDALPNIASQITITLRDRRPDVGDQIETTVYDVVFDLVPRRLDLNNEVSLLWASLFSEEELDQITAFYSSEVGQRLNAMFNDMVVESLQLFDDWYRRTYSEAEERARILLEQQGITF